MTKFVEDQRLIQFLMGLNDLYAQARGNILMLNPLPGINHAYSLLLQDENQREVYVNPQFSPNNSSFMAKNFNSQMKLGNQIQKPGYPGQSSQRSRGQFQHSGGQPRGQRLSANPQRNFTPKNPRKVRRNKYNPNVSCTHCLMTHMQKMTVID